MIKEALHISLTPEINVSTEMEVQSCQLAGQLHSKCFMLKDHRHDYANKHSKIGCMQSLILILVLCVHVCLSVPREISKTKCRSLHFFCWRKTRKAMQNKAKQNTNVSARCSGTFSKVGIEGHALHITGTIVDIAFYVNGKLITQ